MGADCIVCCGQQFQGAPRVFVGSNRVVAVALVVGGTTAEYIELRVALVVELKLAGVVEALYECR
jgi:hypothetical protein